MKICNACGKQFFRKISKDRPGKFCGYGCYHKSLKGVRVGIFWEIATEQQKLERIRYYFDKHVIRQEGCWGWKGALSGNGYGFISVNSNNNGKRIHSNRVSWMIHFGEIPKGLLVCHTCDNRSCANPKHLFLGTTKDNAIDRKIKGRNGDQFGEKNGSSKLTYEQVNEIRELLKKNITGRSIAKLFNISDITVSNIKTGRIWKNHGK